MNYRHLYHAGNFSDVMKHLILTWLLEKLREKETPFRVLDTHAGRGLYNLTTKAAQKNREYRQGIGSLLEQKNFPDSFLPYIERIRALNEQYQQGNQALVYYPGSPLIVRPLLRPQDKLVLCEWQEEEYQELKRLFPHDRKVAVHHQDAYLALNAFLPFPERRGLIFMDPPFEDKEEFVQLTTAIKKAYEKFPTAIYALWFPIKVNPYLDIFYRKMRAAKFPGFLIAEFLLYPRHTVNQLNGCGMLFINAPWQFDKFLKKNLSLLLTSLGKSETGEVIIHQH